MIKTRKRCILIMILAALTVASASTVNAVLAPPLDIKLELSANFAELRPNHFHGGIDFKTQGVTSLPVFSVAPGYISRVEVSPTGYGQVMYVVHPIAGYTTVYGHLDSFGEIIDKMVLERQKALGRFDVELNFIPWFFPVNAATEIARSGNTGHSGGPHLHFEIRETNTGYAIDPLPFYSNLIPDTRAPRIHGIALIAGNGMVDGSSRMATRGPANLATPFTAWGEVWPAICANDAMDGQNNIYGVRKIELFVDGTRVWSRTLERFDMGATRAINTLVPIDELSRTGHWWEWTRIPAAMPLPLGLLNSTLPGGSLNIDSQRDYECMYVLTDLYGNTSEHRFTIRGIETEIDRPAPEGQQVRYHRPATISKEMISVYLPPFTLYDNAFVDVRAEEGIRAFSVLNSGLQMPMSAGFEITVDLGDYIPNNINKLFIVDLATHRAIPTKWEGNRLIGKASGFGRYGVREDTDAPEISHIGGINFIIRDNLSGINSFRAEVDGKFVVMDYDLKSNSLSYRRGQPAPRRGSLFTLTVTDNAGNTSRLSHIIP